VCGYLCQAQSISKFVVPFRFPGKCKLMGFPEGLYHEHLQCMGKQILQCVFGV
jgi:hypothetical protein